MKITRGGVRKEVEIGLLLIGDVIEYNDALYLLVGNVDQLWRGHEWGSGSRLAIHLPSMQLQAIPRKDKAALVRSELIVE